MRVFSLVVSITGLLVAIEFLHGSDLYVAGGGNGEVGQRLLNLQVPEEPDFPLGLPEKNLNKEEKRLLQQMILQWQINLDTDDDPTRAEKYLILARAYRDFNWDVQKTIRAYQGAWYAAVNSRARKQDDATAATAKKELAKVVDELIAPWEKAVKNTVDKDPVLRKLAAKYTLVLLHSRRYAGGEYLKSTYSFSAKSRDQEDPKFFAELQFDNGRGDKHFQVNMLGGQENLVADLGKIDFEKVVVPEKPDFKDTKTWLDYCKGVPGHVYLQRIHDDRGVDFFVTFKVVAVDPHSDYMAFIWRRLPPRE